MDGNSIQSRSSRCPVVFVVDHDEASRVTVSNVVRDMDVPCVCYGTAGALLRERIIDSCIVVSETSLPDMSGTQLQDELKRRGLLIPSIFVSQSPRVAEVVQLVKNGATNVIEKPFEAGELRSSLSEALATLENIDEDCRARQAVRGKIQRLSDGQRDVLRFMLEGKRNSEIAALLHISVRTVEQRRRRIKDKMEVDSHAELIRVVVESDVDLSTSEVIAS